MTDSFTRCCKKLSAELALFFSWAALALSLAAVCAPLRAQPGAPEVDELRLERLEDGLYLSTQVRFELAPPVEDALNKGIAMFFVAEADLLRNRWYWYDLKVASAAKTFRLAYQPLTRRWRLNTTAGAQSESGGALNQHFDTLAEALATMRRITQWKIAEAADLAPGARHHVDFRFRLDVSQLPRPFQIGAVGQADWNLSVSVRHPLAADTP